MTLTEKSGHLAWCALVALALACQDGTVRSPAQENLFSHPLAGHRAETAALLPGDKS
ncbi:TPA: hypothetical protein N3A33_005086 [Salmonella enterica subsp. salamae serovar 28:r:e,n,z15]|nr:hypothetical protein [Salmonella enterica subsp. salamae serovar 28:r:e,n,z15]